MTSRIGIIGLGAWLPVRVEGNELWPSEFVARLHSKGERTFNDIPDADDPESAAITSRHLRREAGDPFLGAVRRHIADPSMTAPVAESLAAERAIVDAGIDPLRIGRSFSFSTVPKRISPQSAAEVAYRTGAHNATAISMDNACASSVIQLIMAREAILSGNAEYVLCTQSHLVWQAMPLTHPASPGLGDIATAFVVGRSDSAFALRSSFTVTHGEFADAVLWKREVDEHGVESEPRWYAPGGRFWMGSDAPHQVKHLMQGTVTFAHRTITEAIARAGIDVQDISIIAAVQPRGFLAEAFAERLGLPKAVAVHTYESIGHVGACGPVYNLMTARGRAQIAHGASIALYGQGAGFTRAAAVLEAP